METYDNAYKKEEDELLWEIHEIRNDIHSSKSYDDLNSLNKKITSTSSRFAYCHGSCMRKNTRQLNGSRLKWLLY
jgi:hypothetical protein